jgi:hypothetical protein
MKVTLDMQGDSYSWFQVYPRYKIDRYASFQSIFVSVNDSYCRFAREGDRIPTSSELFLRVVEKPGEYLHCAHRMLATSTVREVRIPFCRR